MAGLSTITVDLARGEVVLGGRRVVLTPEREPAAAGVPSRFRLEDGGRVRLIGFGERSRLVRDALADASPSGALVTLLRAAAYEGARSAVSDAVLLAMAGGAEDAPEFDTCAVDVSRLQAWSWLSVHDAPAILVDRASARPSAASEAGEWNRFVFPGADARGLDALVDEMVASLLARGVPPRRARNAGRQDAAASNEAAATQRRGTAASASRSASEKPVGDPATERPPLSDSVPLDSRARVETTDPVVPHQSPVAARAPTPHGGAMPAPLPFAEPGVRTPAAAYPAPLRIHRLSRPAPAADSATTTASTAASAASAARRASGAGRTAARAVSFRGSLSGAVSSVVSGAGPPSMGLSAVSTAFSASAVAAAAVAAAPARAVAPARAEQTAIALSRAQLPASVAPTQSRSAALAAPAAAHAARRRLAASADALGQIARALAAECDLRGLDT